MHSILPEYNCDIFISYRQNDNKYDGWVTEFVTKLQQELEATLKGRLNIYFDENPHDGLHDSHDVSQSLSNKLKTLIFIPIISQTYCDTESFAWKHEFKPFLEGTSTDKLGLSVTLPNGNVASRVLPIRIHDIDPADTRLLESELSGVLRSIDFVYSNAGVNRPLLPKDDELRDNAYATIYRNQINKVANAIKELVNGIKSAGTQASPPQASQTSITEKPAPASTIHATVPKSLNYQVVNQKATTVYLAWTSTDLKPKREEMALILKKAGFNVLPLTDCPADDEGFKTKVIQDMSKCDCSLHMLSQEYGRRFEMDEEVSFPRYQFDEAIKLAAVNPEFHSFIWYTPDPNGIPKPAQLEFVKYIRNNITRNMTFSNSLGPMQLVDDMRAILKKQEKTELDVMDTDIFFIFNQQDEGDAQNITDSISLEYPVETMNILPDGEEEYREMSRQQIPKSKLAVIYFKYAADWALPFIKQIWKSVGGASSPTYLMLIGEDEPAQNKARTFKAPKVVSNISPKETIPEEIKKVYTHILNLK